MMHPRLKRGVFHGGGGCWVDNGSRNGDRRRNLNQRFRKNHEIMFEACKHFTTLDTAALLIVVAVFREPGYGLSVVVWPLVWFGLSLALCAYGMLATALGGLDNTKVAISAGGALIAGALVFFAGLVQTVLALLLYFNT